MSYVNYFSIKLEKKKRIGFFSLEHYSLTELSPKSDEKLEDFKPASAMITITCGRSANVHLRNEEIRLLFFLSDGGAFPFGTNN